MPRKGWSSLETPTGWYQVIRGPRPQAVQWPRQQRRSSSSWWQPGGLNQGRPPHQQSVKSSKGFAKPAVSPPSVRLSPDERVAEARARVARLEAALQVLGETSPEAQPIQEALRKARAQCRVQPVGERLDSTLKFIQRSRARIEKIQVDLTREYHFVNIFFKIWSCIFLLSRQH